MGKREELIELMRERGVLTAEAEVDKLDEPDIERALGAVAQWDAEGAKGPGLLVWMIRNGSGFGYKRPEERTKTQSSEVTPTLLKAIRGLCNSPNGFSRDEARTTFGPKARRMGWEADDLIDAAMGAEWLETPTIAALDHDNPLHRSEYERWVAGR